MDEAELRDDAYTLAHDLFPYIGRQADRQITINARRIRAYGDQCRRAGAAGMREAASEALKDPEHEPQDGEWWLIDRARKRIQALPPPAAEAASPAAGWQRSAILALDHINKLASADPRRTFDDAIRLLDLITDEARAGLSGTPWPLPDAPSEEARAGRRDIASAPKDETLVDEWLRIANVPFNSSAFGRRLADRIEAVNLSHRDVAKMLKLGHATISRICSGHAPSIGAYVKIEAWLSAPSEEARAG